MLREDNQLLADLDPVLDITRRIWDTRILKDSKHLIKTTRLLQIAHTHSFELAKSFAMMLTRIIEELCMPRLSFITARLEGVNNKIKVIK